MKEKLIRITDEQNEWIEKNGINFTKWVRNKINEEMS
jgi:hypothetical protein